jgi:hypothetical protein
VKEFADLASLQTDLQHRPQHLRFILLCLLTAGLNPLAISTISPQGRVAFFRVALFYRACRLTGSPLSSLDPHLAYLETANTTRNFRFPSHRQLANEAITTFCRLTREMASIRPGELRASNLPTFVNFYRSLSLLRELPDGRHWQQWEREHPGFQERAQANTMREAMAALNGFYRYVDTDYGDVLKLAAGAFQFPEVPLKLALPEDAARDPFRRLAQMASSGSETLFGLSGPRESLILEQFREEEFWARPPELVIEDILSLLVERTEVQSSDPITSIEDLSYRIDEAREILRDLARPWPGMGHNQPPETLDDVLDEYEHAQSDAALDTILYEAAEPPGRRNVAALKHALAVIDKISRKLARLGRWAGAATAIAAAEEIFGGALTTSPRLQQLQQLLYEIGEYVGRLIG